MATPTGSPGSPHPRSSGPSPEEPPPASPTGQPDPAGEPSGTTASPATQGGATDDEQRQRGLADYVNQAADRIDSFARTLENKDLGEIVDNVQSFARRHPALFVGGAFAIGIIAARFMLSSGRGVNREAERR
jgi:hypothetical protein